MLDAIEAGQTLDSTLLVSDVRPGTTRRGSAFLTLTVQDRSARLSAKIWDPETLCPEGVEVPAPYRIRARVESYRDELQLNVEAIRPAQPSPEEMAALVPSSRWSPAELEASIREHIATHVRNPTLRRIADTFLDDPLVVPRFWEVPAAAANHHAYRCGLAEHTLSMMRVATALHAHYEAYYPGLLQKDLLLVGVLLHDMGKVWEFEDAIVARYSTAGRLVGHIPMMSAHVERRCRELGDIPEPLIWELQHLVLAHHGEYEYGSPRRPKTAEAQLLHHIDMIDARMAMFHDAGTEEGWTPFHRALGRPLLAGGAERGRWLGEPSPAAGMGDEHATPPPGAGRGDERDALPAKAEDENAQAPNPPEAEASAEVKASATEASATDMPAGAEESAASPRDLLERPEATARRKSTAPSGTERDEKAGGESASGNGGAIDRLTLDLFAPAPGFTE